MAQTFTVKRLGLHIGAEVEGLDVSQPLDDAEQLLEAVLKLAPDYLAARLDYIRVLLDRQKYMQAQEAIDALLSLEPGNRDYLSLQAAACAGLGQHEQAIAELTYPGEREMVQSALSKTGADR